MTFLYIIYDGRAETADLEDCSVYTTEGTEEAAKAACVDGFDDGVVYRYREDGDRLVDPVRIER